MSFGFEKKEIKQENVYVPRRTIIECTLCGTKFFSCDFHKKNAAQTCECKNVKIGIINVTYAKFENFVTVNFSKKRPLIYEEEREQGEK